MSKSSTIELTIFPKAAPMMTPTARSTALPLTANSLNSFHTFIGRLSSLSILLDCNNVDQLVWLNDYLHNPDLRGGFHSEYFCNRIVFYLFLGGIDGLTDSAASSSV